MRILIFLIIIISIYGLYRFLTAEPAVQSTPTAPIEELPVVEEPKSAIGYWIAFAVIGWGLAIAAAVLL